MRKKSTRINGEMTGKKFALLMKEHGVSIRELASYLDVSDNAVRNYLSGTNLPSTERLYMICKMFDIDIRDILVEETIAP